MWGKIGASRVVHFFPDELVHQIPINRWVRVWSGYPACSSSVQDRVISRDSFEFSPVGKPIQARTCAVCLAWLAYHPDGHVDFDY